MAEKDLDIAMKDAGVRTFMQHFKGRVVAVEPIRRKGEGKEE